MIGAVGPHASDVVFSLEVIEWGNRKSSVHVVAIKQTCFDIALGKSAVLLVTFEQNPLCALTSLSKSCCVHTMEPHNYAHTHRHHYFIQITHVLSESRASVLYPFFGTSIMISSTELCGTRKSYLSKSVRCMCQLLNTLRGRYTFPHTV